MKTALQAAHEFHRQREAEQYRRREALRQKQLAAVRGAIQELAPAYLGLQAVYLFGSILQDGRFTPNSDIDVALECDATADCATIESNFWQRLEWAMRWNIDVRPYQPPLRATIDLTGERVYARESAHPRACHSKWQI